MSTFADAQKAYFNATPEKQKLELLDRISDVVAYVVREGFDLKELLVTQDVINFLGTNQFHGPTRMITLVAEGS
jgi:hypothetical protein